MMKDSQVRETIVSPTPQRIRLRAIMEVLSNIGLLLVAVGLVAPFFAIDNFMLATIFKWVFAAGAVIFTGARIVGAIGKDGPFRARRMRRMEVWAGIAFCVASCFWFYNSSSLGVNVLTFRMLHETIIFTLAGAMIQIVASWILSSALRKQQKMSHTPEENEA